MLSDIAYENGHDGGLRWMEFEIASWHNIPSITPYEIHYDEVRPIEVRLTTFWFACVPIKRLRRA